MVGRSSPAGNAAARVETVPSTSPSSPPSPPPPGAPCLFCSLVAGRGRVHLVLDEPEVVAFLDNRPLFPGHTLLVTRRHVEVLADLPDELIEPYFVAARRLSVAMESVLGAAGSFVALNNHVSQSVPHLHTHVVPRRPKDGLRGFFWPRGRYVDEAEAAEIAARLRAGLRRAPGRANH